MTSDNVMVIQEKGKIEFTLKTFSCLEMILEWDIKVNICKYKKINEFSIIWEWGKFFIMIQNLEAIKEIDKFDCKHKPYKWQNKFNKYKKQN